MNREESAIIGGLAFIVAYVASVFLIGFACGMAFEAWVR